MKIKAIVAAALCLAGCGRFPEDGTHTLHILTTNDVHAAWFDSTYVGGKAQRSLYAVNWYVDSVRVAEGRDNVLLIDAGDCLQGDNASYYYNYVDTLSPHLFPRIADYMDYDVITVGNHDVETGHPVYDRVRAELESAGIPFLGGNAVRADNGEPYFQLYSVFERSGLKVLVLGYTNANMKAWLNESLWSGMDFKSLIPLVQEDVDRISAKEKPQIVIVSVHSGTGDGDGDELEDQGLDLFNSLHGVDAVICSHDHSPFTACNSEILLVNSGNKASNIGHAQITVNMSNGKVVSKELSAGLIPVRAEKADPGMREFFKEDYGKVREFTMREVGMLKKDMKFSESFKGMSDYVNLIHTVCLECQPAQISIAAPLTQNAFIPAGKLIYNDLFTLYRYENQLFVVKMTGDEIRRFLEYSYNLWICTINGPDDHVLNIEETPDSRYGRWSFKEASYNFDSAAGIYYTVDVTEPYGSRVRITSLADGTPFDLSATYNVAMTSYRASGGGGAMTDGAGVDTSKIEERVVSKYPEIRDLIYQYIVANGEIAPDAIGNPSVIGGWKFIPEDIVKKPMARDYALMFE